MEGLREVKCTEYNWYELCFCIGFITWIIAGYSFVFSGDGLFGNFDNVLLNNIKVTNLTGTIPTYLFVAFQGSFAAIAVAIVSGSIIERVKFSTWCIFVPLWILFIYCPVAHWLWRRFQAIREN